jgi:hypothetical protein
MRTPQTTVIPFPQVCRRRFIAKIAARLDSMSAKAAEKLLAATIKQQADAMTRGGNPRQPDRR